MYSNTHEFVEEATKMPLKKAHSFKVSNFSRVALMSSLVGSDRKMSVYRAGQTFILRQIIKFPSFTHCFCQSSKGLPHRLPLVAV